MVTQEQLDKLHAAATKRKSEGYFKRVAEGDQRAASLFARLCAQDVNPNGADLNSFGWLKKGGGTNVDGWAEDAVCGNANPSDLLNVTDMVNGAGQSGASLPAHYLVSDLKERRTVDTWSRPKPLTNEESDYLLDGNEPEPPHPPVGAIPSYEELGGDAGGMKISQAMEADYKEAGRPGLDGGCGAWMQRTVYDFLAGNCATVEESIAKHRPEWRAALGLSV